MLARLRRKFNEWGALFHKQEPIEESPLKPLLPKKTPIFTRYPTLKYVLIGAIIGFVVVGMVALAVYTLGAGPALLGAGAAIGGTFGLSGLAATAVGCSILGFLTVAAGAVVGAVTRFVSNLCHKPVSGYRILTDNDNDDYNSSSNSSPTSDGEVRDQLKISPPTTHLAGSSYNEPYSGSKDDQLSRPTDCSPPFSRLFHRPDPSSKKRSQDDNSQDDNYRSQTPSLRSGSGSGSESE